YVDFAKVVCQTVLAQKNAKGILLCGSGSGMCIAANKVRGIRAATCTDTYMAKFARFDNDVNVLCLRTRGVTFASTKRILDVWLNTKFSGEVRHKRRIGKIGKLELSQRLKL